MHNAFEKLHFTFEIDIPLENVNWDWKCSIFIVLVTQLIQVWRTTQTYEIIQFDVVNSSNNDHLSKNVSNM